MAVEERRKRFPTGEVAKGVKGRRLPGGAVENCWKRFFLQLLDPMASLFDYLYGKHKQIAQIQKRLT